MLKARYCPPSMAVYSTVTSVPTPTLPCTLAFLSTTNCMVCLSAPVLTSNAKECPPFPMEVTFPLTILVACSDRCPGAVCGEVACTQTAPAVSNNPARAAESKNFRIGYPPVRVAGHISGAPCLPTIAAGIWYDLSLMMCAFTEAPPGGPVSRRWSARELTRPSERFLPPRPHFFLGRTWCFRRRNPVCEIRRRRRRAQTRFEKNDQLRGLRVERERPSRV